jgi:hypothetical protein
VGKIGEKVPSIGPDLGPGLSYSFFHPSQNGVLFFPLKSRVERDENPNDKIAKIGKKTSQTDKMFTSKWH